MTPPRIEPAAFRLVVPCLNQLRYRVPLIRREGFYKERRRELFTYKVWVSGYDTALQTGRWVSIILIYIYRFHSRGTNTLQK
jgi:hypothetical protein